MIVQETIVNIRKYSAIHAKNPQKEFPRFLIKLIKEERNLG